MSEQTQKCIKCGSPIADGEGKTLKKGPICTKCAKKRNNGTIFGSIGGVLAAAAVAVGITYSTNKVDTFAGVGEINDNIDIENVEIQLFDISKSSAISAPTSIAEALDDITLFKAKLSSTMESLTGNDTSIQIPAIAVLFALNSYDLSSSSTELLEEYAKVFCSTDKQATILVDGYTCDLGGDELNTTLSQNRAASVKAQLVKYGVPADKIQVNGFGKSKYGTLGLNTKEENRRANISIK